MAEDCSSKEVNGHCWVLQTAYPSAPTWMMYAGDHTHCMNSIPIAISRGSFCKYYQGAARVYQLYEPWVLSMLLVHANVQLHTYPKVLFKTDAWSLSGAWTRHPRYVRQHTCFVMMC